MRRHASPKFHQSNNERDIDIGWFAWNHLTHLAGFAGIYMSDDGNMISHSTRLPDKREQDIQASISDAPSETKSTKPP